MTSAGTTEVISTAAARSSITLNAEYGATSPISYAGSAPRPKARPTPRTGTIGARARNPITPHLVVSPAASAAKNRASEAPANHGRRRDCAAASRRAM